MRRRWWDNRRAMELSPIVYYLALIPALLVAITCHEYAHARVALAYGDPTAQQAGRVTLNPLAHLDPLGTLGIFLVGFGWGKPVPVNRNLLRDPRADLFVSAAGPLTNLLLAAVGGLLLRAPVVRDGILFVAGQGALIFLPLFVELNLALGLFNLIPLGPLDGAHVVENLLPVNQAARFGRANLLYGSLALLGLILIERVSAFSPLSMLLGPPMTFLRALFLGG